MVLSSSRLAGIFACIMDSHIGQWGKHKTLITSVVTVMPKYADLSCLNNAERCDIRPMHAE